MKKAISLFFFLSIYIFSPAQLAHVIGDWYGVADINGTKLSIVFHISNDQGQLMATMDSPDQKAFGIPVDSVSFINEQLVIKVNSIVLTYEGRINATGEINGRVKQRGIIDVPVILSRQPKEIVREPKPQDPQPPFNYSIEEVEFVNEKGGHLLKGTLTSPKNSPAVAHVVLLSGSGAQDRDESLSGHKPFWVIADHLVRQNIAVLRFDDRGTGESEGKFEEADIYDLGDDALAAVSYLKTRTDINPQSIGLIGHSEGGMIAPLAATKDEDIQFIILLSGPGTKGRQVILSQSRLIAEVQRIPEYFIEKTASDLSTIMDAIEKYEDPAESAREITEFIYQELDQATPEQIAAMGGREKMVKMNLDIYNTRWMRSFIKFEPKLYLEQLTCPVLALNGTLDLQVPYKENLEAIEAGLKTAGNDQYKIMALEGLNHLFQHAKKGTPDEYGTIEETFDLKTLNIIVDWIKEISG